MCMSPATTDIVFINIVTLLYIVFRFGIKQESPTEKRKEKWNKRRR